MLYSVRERCQQFNDPNVSLNTMTPLLLWERGLMSLYDLTVPESIMNWTGHVDHSDSDSSSVDESDTEPEAEPPPATTASLATVQLPNSQSQDAVLLHCFTAFPQMCPPRGYDDRWNRFVDILNVLGPRGTSIEWKTVRYGQSVGHSHKFAATHAQCSRLYPNSESMQPSPPWQRPPNAMRTGRRSRRALPERCGPAILAPW